MSCSSIFISELCKDINSVINSLDLDDSQKI